MPKINKSRKVDGKKAYVSKQKTKKKELMQSSVKDMGQDFRLKKAEAQLAQLNKASKGWSTAMADSAAIPTLVGSTRSSQVLLSALTVSDIHTASGGQNMGIVEDWTYTIKHIGFNYTLNIDLDSENAVVGTSTMIRVVMLVVHKQAGDSNSSAQSLIPNMNDIFLWNQTGTATSADLMAHYNRLGRNNFEILYDKIHVLSPNEGQPIAGGNNQAGMGQPFTQVHRVDVSPSKRSETVRRNTVTPPTATALSDTAENCYYLAVFSDNPTNADPPLITYNIVVDYLV